MSEESTTQPNSQEQPTGASQSQFNQFPPQGGFQYGMQQPLPNATAVLILGILSILGCCCYGVIGIALAIVALVLAKKDRQAYAMNSSIYTLSSYKNMNAGRICAIIGLIISVLYLILYGVLFAVFGYATLTDPEALREALEGLQ